jgi:hypothetical protein
MTSDSLGGPSAPHLETLHRPAAGARGLKRRWILLLSIISLGEFVLTHFTLLQHFPNSGDEQSWMFEAKVLASGKLYVRNALYDESHELNKFIQSDGLLDYHGRRFSKYPPGWPMLLALGVLAHAMWLVNPVLGAVTVALMLIYARDHFGPESVWKTWLLVTLCSFFCVFAANYQSQASTMTFLFGAFFAYDQANRRTGAQRIILTALAGALLGYAALIRYLDWCALMLWIVFDLFRRKEQNRLIPFLAAFGAIASWHLIYNTLTIGAPLALPVSIYGRTHPHVFDRLVVSWEGFKVTQIRLTRLIRVFPPVLLLGFWFAKRVSLKEGKSLLALFALNAFAYFFFVMGIGGPGPRFFLSYFPFLILATVELIQLGAANQLIRKAAFVAICLLFVGSCEFGREVASSVYERMDLARTVARIDSKKIIVLESCVDGMEIADLIRNPPELFVRPPPTVYLGYADGVGLDRMLQNFPGYPVYFYRYPGQITQTPSH